MFDNRDGRDLNSGPSGIWLDSEWPRVRIQAGSWNFFPRIIQDVPFACFTHYCTDAALYVAQYLTSLTKTSAKGKRGEI